MTVTCKRCGEICEVDGEFPKFFAWCETCNDYADADMEEFTREYAADIADSRPEGWKPEDRK